MRSMRRAISAEPSGNGGVNTIAEAASRYEEDHFPDDWMHCVKLLGQSLMARGFDRHVAEIQIRVAVLNRYTVLGIPVTEPAG